MNEFQLSWVAQERIDGIVLQNDIIVMDVTATRSSDGSWSLSSHFGVDLGSANLLDGGDFYDAVANVARALQAALEQLPE